MDGMSSIPGVVRGFRAVKTFRIDLTAATHSNQEIDDTVDRCVHLLPRLSDFRTAAGDSDDREDGSEGYPGVSLNYGFRQDSESLPKPDVLLQPAGKDDEVVWSAEIDGLAPEEILQFVDAGTEFRDSFLSV